MNAKYTRPKDNDRGDLGKAPASAFSAVFQKAVAAVAEDRADKADRQRTPSMSRWRIQVREKSQHAAPSVIPVPEQCNSKYSTVTSVRLTPPMASSIVNAAALHGTSLIRVLAAQIHEIAGPPL
jgi:hypothetical protein